MGTRSNNARKRVNLCRASDSIWCVAPSPIDLLNTGFEQHDDARRLVITCVGYPDLSILRLHFFFFFFSSSSHRSPATSSGISACPSLFLTRTSRHSAVKLKRTPVSSLCPTSPPSPASLLHKMSKSFAQKCALDVPLSLFR